MAVELWAAALSTIVGSGISAYVVGRLTENGRRAATKADMEAILREEGQRAYEQEKGKRLATHEDIDRVLTELRLVTHETETIKAKIGAELWMTQARFNQKRDAYANLIALSTQLSSAYATALVAVRRRTALSAHLNSIVELDMKFYNAQAIAWIFLSSDCIQTITQYIQAKSKGIELSEEWLSEHMRLITQLAHDLSNSARKEIGVDAP